MDITINESQIPKLLEFYNSKQTELRDHILTLKKELDENQVFIDSLTNKTKDEFSLPKLFNHDGEANVGYNQKLAWLDKICFVLKMTGQVMNTTEIVETIMKLETGDRERKSFVSSISGTISLKQGKGKIARISIENEYYVALSEWMENGNLKSKFDKK